MSFFQRLKEGLSKTRQVLSDKLDAILPFGARLDDATIEELESLLITSDFGVEVAASIIKEARQREKNDADRFRQALCSVIEERLLTHQPPWSCHDRPHVILVVGVNGVGKTTTIGKLAWQFREEGRQVLLAAGDTFRAAAVDQLKVWGQRAGCPVIAQGQNADSASVVFDAHAAAVARGCDLLIVDTAGRLHTRHNLMDELKKIQRTLTRNQPSAPHDVWLVLDATTGQNAINQVKEFHRMIGLTGLIITKLDGTARGGVVVGIHEQFQLPIRYIGVGEGIDDLKPFQPREFVAALFGGDR
ncbi:MAG: signal recognition particle-docking protein FtsY [Magnetococcales bacterium]|nr:signal recognition particle-docking protein FtsY [Magnetococcales bacterium]